MGLLDKMTSSMSSPALDAVLGKNATDASGAVVSESKLNGPANAMINQLITVGIEGAGPLESARAVADKHLQGASVDKAVADIIAGHKKLAAAGGFVTGLGGFVTMPVAIPANVAEFYLLATRMVAGIASARGYDIDKAETRSAVLLALVGAESADVLAKAGVLGTTRLSTLAADRLPQAALMMINKGVGFRIVKNLGEKGLSRFLGKGIPVAGGVIGGGLDWYMMGRIADYAKQQFPARTAGAIGA